MKNEQILTLPLGMHHTYQVNRLIMKLADHLGDTDAKPNEKKLQNDILAPNSPLKGFVAIDRSNDGGTIVGFTIFCPSVYSTNHNEWNAFVVDLYVEEAFRGRGIGKELLIRVADWCTKPQSGVTSPTGLKHIYLEVATTNKKAQAFYANLGGVRYKTVTREETGETSYIMKFTVSELL